MIEKNNNLLILRKTSQQFLHTCYKLHNDFALCKNFHKFSLHVLKNQQKNSHFTRNFCKFFAFERKWLQDFPVLLKNKDFFCSKFDW